MSVKHPELKDLPIQLEEALLGIDRLRVKELLTRAYPDSTSFQVVEELVVPALEAIGAGWEAGNISLSQVYMSGRICEELVDLILPPGDPVRINQPKMAIAVLEDYHQLGMRIVYSVLRASGFELQNYGHIDMETLIKRVQEEGVKILLISALMLPSALKVKELVKRTRQTNSDMKIVVGGAPFRFDRQLWSEVGADAFGANAAEAVEIVQQMIGEIS